MALVALASAGGGLLLGHPGPRAAEADPSPSAVSQGHPALDAAGRRVEFGLGSLSVRREGAGDFSVLPGGLRVISADLAEGRYDLLVDEPGERDAGKLTLDLAFSPDQAADRTMAPLRPDSVMTSLGVVEVKVLDADDRRLETRLAPVGEGLRIDVQDADAAYPLSISVRRVQPEASPSAFSLGERGIGLPVDSGIDMPGGGIEVPPLQAPPERRAIPCSYLDLSEGNRFTLAVGSDHKVYSWGYGAQGQLGDDDGNGSTAYPEQRPHPQEVAGLSNIDAVAAGGQHGVALDSNGSVWTWGANDQGQLGIGSLLGTPVPQQVTIPGTPTIVAIAAGFEYTLAVASDGTAWAWGKNSFGQLGDGTNNRKTSPVQVSGVTTAVSAAAGVEHSLLLLSDSSLVAFGRNDAGQLGDNSTTTQFSPVAVSGISGVEGIAAGEKHSLAWKTDGSAWSWGANNVGQLGDGTTTGPRLAPGAVPSLSTGVDFMEAGYSHSLAVKSDGTVMAWGANSSGEVGDTTLVSPKPTPAPVSGVTGATRCAAGFNHSGALTSSGRVLMWGSNIEGQLALSIAAGNTFPVHVLDFDYDGFLSDVTAISAGKEHSLAVKSDGSVWAWGTNTDGQLGDGTSVSKLVPVQVMAAGSGAIAVAAGANHSLALLSSGEVRSWGSDASGQLGNGSGGSSTTPVVVLASGNPGTGTALTGISQIAAGDSFSLALVSATGNVKSWGSGSLGRLGNGTTSGNQQNPVLVIDGGSAALVNIIDIDAGDAHGLAVRNDDFTYAWGSDSDGQLGNGGGGQTSRAVQVTGLFAGSGCIGVAAGDSHSLALMTGGTVKSWGRGAEGQIGNGNTNQEADPVNVLGLTGVTEIDAGGKFSLALLSGGGVRAWGSNSSGRLSDGTFTQRELPVAVRDLSGITKISAGNAHALALKSDGTIWGMGDATLHALGVNYSASISSAKRAELGPQCSNQPPTCGAGTDIVATSCGPTLAGTASDPDGDLLSVAWTTTCTGVTFTPGANVLTPQVFFADDCGIDCNFTLTVTDPSNASSSDTVNVKLNDATAPVGTAGTVDACYTSQQAAENAATLATDWTDDCHVGAEHVSTSFSLVDCTATITVTAEDYCGNVGTGIVYTTRIDSVAPVLSGVPANTTIECDDPLPAATVTASDDCDGAVIVNYAETPSGSLCGGARPTTITRTWSATDSCGNSTSQSQVVTIEDTTPPDLSDVPADVTIGCGDPLPPVATPTATDACAGIITPQLLESGPTAGTCPALEVYTRTWTAYDDCGNFVTATQTITVADTTPPTLSGVPGDVTVSCNAVPAMATVTATDACDPTVPVVPDEVRTDGACPDTYTLTRTWTSTDDCGNTAVGTQVITVQDIDPPVLTGVPGDATVECDAVPAPASPAAGDNCDPAPSIQYTEVRYDGTCPSRYTLRRTWVAKDRCGNTSTGIQLLDVVDMTPPALAGVPADETVECDAVPAPADVTATDNCSTPTPVYVETSVPGSCPQSYTLQRTWTATDDCGNSVSATQVITVQDTTAPTLLNVPADVTVECDSVPAALPLLATDNCYDSPHVTVADVIAPGACPDSYKITRTWTATDACSNSSSASQVITVVDTTGPMISGVPADVTVSCTAVPPVASPTASDNCDGSPTLTFSQTRTDGACPDTYTLTRTWTATDRCGNETVETQVVTVQDIDAPVLSSAPGAMTVQCDALPSPASVTATDNCDPSPVVTFSEERADGPCMSTYILTRTWTATDRCGNVATRQQLLTVVDDTPPVVTPAATDISCIWPANHKYKTYFLADFSPTITDNCNPNPSYVFMGCQSNQADDNPGGFDGTTVDDCVVDPAGQWIKVRAECDSKKAGGRRYNVTIAGDDGCGNLSAVTSIGFIYVPKNNPGQGCVKPDQE